MGRQAMGQPPTELVAARMSMGVLDSKCATGTEPLSWLTGREMVPWLFVEGADGRLPRGWQAGKTMPALPLPSAGRAGRRNNRLSKG